MSDEYLWDKTGSDPQIEQLESALVNYRYQQGAPPRLPVVGTATAKPRPLLFRLSLAFAGAACLAMIAATAIWLSIARKAQTPDVVQSKYKPTEGKSYQPAPTQPAPKGPSIPAPVKFSAPPRKLPKDRIRDTIAKRNVKPEPVLLTKDEQYAYDQLKLALWIAGTKAKVVQDTIDRVGEQRSPSARNNK